MHHVQCTYLSLGGRKGVKVLCHGLGVVACTCFDTLRSLQFYRNVQSSEIGVPTACVRMSITTNYLRIKNMSWSTRSSSPRILQSSTLLRLRPYFRFAQQHSREKPCLLSLSVLDLSRLHLSHFILFHVHVSFIHVVYHVGHVMIVVYQIIYLFFKCLFFISSIFIFIFLISFCILIFIFICFIHIFTLWFSFFIFIFF